MKLLQIKYRNVTNAVNELIAETGDDASQIDEDKSYLGLRVNATEYEETSRHPHRINDWDNEKRNG